MNPRRPWAWIGLCVVALLPCLAVLVCIHRYAGRLPFEDGWGTPGRLLEALDAGTLHWKEFFVQHNEARKAFSGSVWMLLALGGWNPRVEMYTTVLLIGLCVVFCLQLCRNADPGRSLGPMLVAAAVSVVFFNPIGLVGAHPAWLWGVNLENAIVVTALIGGICANVCLTSWPLRYAISAACSIAATYSFANGMLLWVLLYPRWFGNPRWFGTRRGGAEAPARRGAGLDALYAAAFATVVVTYFIGFERPGEQPGFLDALRRPEKVLAFFGAWLGAPLAPRHGNLPLAVVTGFSGLGLFVWSLVQVARRRMWMCALPFLLLSGYTLVSAAVVSLGRSPFGVSNALASRYCLHVVVFYLGLNGLLWLCATIDVDQRKRRLHRAVLWTALVLQVSSVAGNWVGIYPKQIRHFQARTARGEAAMQFVDLIPDNPDMRNLHQWMKKFVPRFKQLARAGIIEIELAPGREGLTVADATLDQSTTLFISNDGERMRIFGTLSEETANDELTHLLVQSRSAGQEKFVSVIPLSIFPRARGTAQRAIDAVVSLGNLPLGPQSIELFGYEFESHRIVPLGVESQQRHGRITPAEILDAAGLELRPQPGVACVDVVNNVGVEGRAEVTVPRGGRLAFSGWAYDPGTNEPGARFFVMVGGRLFPSLYGQPRPDVAHSLQRPELLRCGFTCVLEESLLHADISGPFQFVLETRRGEFLLDPSSLTIQRVAR